MYVLAPGNILVPKVVNSEHLTTWSFSSYLATVNLLYVLA